MATPDNLLRARLNGLAQNLARAQTPPHVAVEQLRDEANGRTDLLAAEAGTMLGSYLHDPLYADDILAAYYLAAAVGGDTDTLRSIGQAADTTRAHRARKGSTTEGTIAPKVAEED